MIGCFVCSHLYWDHPSREYRRQAPHQRTALQALETVQTKGETGATDRIPLATPRGTIGRMIRGRAGGGPAFVD
jgi:hypothetical protein